MTVPTLAQLQADADAISKASPAIRKFAEDTVAYLRSIAPAPPPPPPPPSPSPALIFDGRASRMTSLGACFQSPQVWDVLQFTTGDLTLQPDPRFGQVYKVTTGPQSSLSPGCGGPIWASDIVYASMNHAYPAPLGQTLYYADSIRLVSPFTFIDPGWMSLLQLCLGPYDAPVQLQLRGAPLFLYRHPGDVSQVGWTTAAVVQLFGMPIDSWVDAIIGVSWSQSATGSIDVWARQAGAATWGHVYSLGSVQTWQFGPSMPGNNDQMNVYAGYWDNRDRSQFPTNTVLRRGYTITGTLADAQATFGG